MFERSVYQLQMFLTGSGFHHEAVDGLFGPATAESLAKWRISGTNAPQTSGVIEALAKYGTVSNWPRNKTEFLDFYGEFAYKSSKSGLVTVTDNWPRTHLVTMTFPIFGRLTVHKRIAVGLFAVGAKLRGMGVVYPLYTVGVYNPRHKGYSPKRSLSAHAWAAAIDLNWQVNGYGTIGAMPLPVVQIFEMYGWTWGGRWGSLEWVGSQWAPKQASDLPKSDPMHFQAGKDW